MIKAMTNTKYKILEYAFYFHLKLRIYKILRLPIITTFRVIGSSQY